MFHSCFPAFVYCYFLYDFFMIHVQTYGMRHAFSPYLRGLSGRLCILTGTYIHTHAHQFIRCKMSINGSLHSLSRMQALVQFQHRKLAICQSLPARTRESSVHACGRRGKDSLRCCDVHRPGLPLAALVQRRQFGPPDVGGTWLHLLHTAALQGRSTGPLFLISKGCSQESKSPRAIFFKVL